jgi:hypothetical protein
MRGVVSFFSLVVLMCVYILDFFQECGIIFRVCDALDMEERDVRIDADEDGISCDFHVDFSLCGRRRRRAADRR